jgi:Uri superfamily endonuclease
MSGSIHDCSFPFDGNALDSIRWQSSCIPCTWVLPVTADTDAAGGTYTLLVELFEAATIDVGALGSHRFDPGWYAYVGSALGTGGFSRLDRHRELAHGGRDVRHWHIDYLLGHPETDVDTVVKTGDVDGECTVAETIDETLLGDSTTGDGFESNVSTPPESTCSDVPEFGCSDCRCRSHLFYSDRRAPLLAAVESAHQSIDDR